ncbi:alpha/beta hydrolase family protein [Stenotrophomonas sp. GZD-301]|uniref:alpha/beta hydrolase family protein n=1 Tax=Stenotrophomonas sp. GZD-301 TaxID=3404814 RepID=UPI003BB68D82
MSRIRWAAMLAVVCAALSAQAGAVELDRYLRQQSFEDIQISPGGDYIAATIPLEDATAVAILRLPGMEMVGNFRPPKNNHAHTVNWVSNERIVVGLAQKLGARDAPQPTGELFGINADGKRAELLVGYRVQEGQGTYIKVKKAGDVAAYMADDLPDDDRYALIEVWPFSDEPYPQVERMDVLSGRRTMVVRSPVQRGSFTTDNQGEVRFALGAANDRVNKLYYRAPGGEWSLINSQNVSGRTEVPLGFSADGRLAYLQVEQASGPDAIVSWDPETNERRTLLRDAVVDPHRIIRQPGTRIPVGALYLGDTPRTAFFDDTSATARQYRSLEAALGGSVYITSSTRDGGKLLLETWSGRNPGDFFLFDTARKNAAHLASRSHWIDATKSAEVRPVAFKARDGLPLHGFLTLPHGSDGRNLPMVVVPHGGPIGVFDRGDYDTESQLLAAAGYAVMQINFRGSSNYGRAHTEAGRLQWGMAMQDDVTDATRWAIAQGVADKDRICIYGASYGGYAAMMGPVREPGLYRCAAGYVGVYDLPMMYARGDVQKTEFGLNYLREWMGRPKDLADRSPVNLADSIKVPVFLAAGGKDERAPIEHTKRMEAALKKAGVPVESLYYPTEGHGFYTQEHRTEYYSRLLAFLSRSLGGATATTTPAGKGKAP